MTSQCQRNDGFSLGSRPIMVAGHLAAILLLLPICFSRTCVWTGSVCDCTIDCSALCTAPSSCNRPHCFSATSQCCQCETDYFPNGLECTLCSSVCPWMPSAPRCTCSCDSACEKCSVSSSTCVPSCASSCKTCSPLSVCTDCYPHATISGSQCVCDSGYFGSNARYCERCSSQCLTCVTAANMCTSCHPGAVLAGTTCVCPSGFSNDPTNCSICDPKCATCTGSGPSQCLTCRPSLVLTGIAPSSCLCPANSYWDTSASMCKVCDSTCATCSGSSNMTCMSCYGGAGLASTAPSKCVCFPPYEKKLDSSRCLNCHRTCQTCEDETAQFCRSCQSHAVILANGGVGPCTCIDGYFPNPDASVCQACSVTCKTCSGAEDFQCLSCKENAGLTTNHRCTCASAYYASPHAGNCQPCPIVCNPCIGLQAVCVSTIPTPSLSLLEGTTLKLDFDVPLRYNLTSNDISVEAYDMSHHPVLVFWLVDILVPYFTFSINLTIGSLLPDNAANVSVYFPDPSSILSHSGMPINTVPLQIHLTDLFPFLGTSDSIDTSTPIAQVSHYSSQAALSTSLVSSLLTGSFSALWSLFNQLQLLTYIPMTAINLPADLASMLTAINVNDMFPSPLAYIPQPSNSTGCVDLPGYASKYGLNSPIFFENAGIMFTAAFSSFFAYFPLYILSRLRIKWLSNYCQKQLPSFKYTVFLRYWLQSFMDLGLYSVIQLTTMSYCLDYPGYMASITAACIVAPLFIISPVALLVFGIYHKEKFALHGNSQFNSEFGAFFMEFKASKSFAISCFYILFMGRRVVYALGIVFLQDYPVLQALGISGMQLAVGCM